MHYENVEVKQPELRNGGSGNQAECGSPYENVAYAAQGGGSYPSSPRTRIKTFVAVNKDRLVLI